MTDTPSPSSRLHVVDALRGFAIVSILLLHNMEHFDYYYFPSNLPEWMKSLDKSVWETLFFLFSGKSYAIFAMLFGLTFFIQNDNQRKKGKDFRPRFAWRLLLLLGFGLINSAFYEGDILTFYALMGFVLIPVANLNDKTLMWIAAVCLLQPFECYNLVWGLQHPDVKLADPASWSFFGRAGTYIESDSLVKTLWGNFTNGKMAVYLWNWEEGRVFQTAALFMLGLLAGRNRLFNPEAGRIRIWKKVLVIAVLSAIPLYIGKTFVHEWVPPMSIHRPLTRLFTSWYNVAFMLSLVSVFVLLFNKAAAQRILHIFSPYGKMSMSCYMMQSIIGSYIYCGYGLGWYKYTGASYCLLIGIVLAVLQGVFAHWWMGRHKQGPLEIVWHRLTWINL